eukprot:13602102-Heterocapsa_arctica.AAC.1
MLFRCAKRSDFWRSLHSAVAPISGGPAQTRLTLPAVACSSRALAPSDSAPAPPDTDSAAAWTTNNNHSNNY